MIEGQDLQEFFRCHSGPATEHPLKVIRAQVNMRGDLFQRRLLLEMGAYIFNGMSDALIV